MELNDFIAVVVGVDTEAHVPEGHLLLWYGNEVKLCNSEVPNNNVRQKPEVWSVPEEYCKDALPEEIKH